MLWAGLAACCGGRADLAAVLQPAGSVPCTPASGRLTVEVLNQGRRASRATTTSIDFPSFEVRLPTRPLEPGDRHAVSTALPKDCASQGCGFTVIVDSKGEVRESNEDNNRSQGRCAVPSPG